MYLLTIKDGLETRHVGPYLTTEMASNDLKRVLSHFSDRARWKIHALESPTHRDWSERVKIRNEMVESKAS